jgi:glutaminyl-tRNA synthetase
MASDSSKPTDFIRKIITDDVAAGKHGGRVHTRFPPEPNGYLHIGHAKAICLNFGVAEEFDGLCNLRFDDTNPVKEEVEFVESIQNDIHWLGFNWGDRLFHASDYFEQLYQFAIELIEKGKAFVCDLSPEEIREYRGTLTEPGRNSPYRDRSVEENLDLFRRMRAGEFEEGTRVLRAKIDMASPNLNMRDPVIYRILYETHHQTGDEWCIYPMYDYAHPLSDALEGITHSLCSLEFEDNRPLYNWFIENVDVPHHPQQIEFARLNLNYTVMSKRRLIRLVDEGYVNGWDDPRMPTLSGMRRRGITPEAIRTFIDEVGVAKADSVIDVAFLEHCIRQDLDPRTARRMVVLKPLKIVLENYPEDKVEYFEAENHPGDESMGTRQMPFSRELYIERADFREDPPRKYFRLSPGREVRLKYAYLITCNEVIKDENGEVVELRCTYDPETRGGSAPDGRRVRGTLHWVSVPHAIDAEARLYNRLFYKEDPYEVDEGEDFTANLNPDSLEVLPNTKLEPSMAGDPVGSRYQFFRQGYFCVDPDSTEDHLVFNEIVSLRDTWAKIEKKLRQEKGK